MNIVRAMKIHNALVKQELKRFLEYKSDFAMGIFSFLTGQTLYLFFIWIVFSNIPNLVGWSLGEIVFLYGFSLIPKGIDHLLFDNLWTFANFTVKNGDFDKYLVRPVNTLFYVMAERVQIDALGELLMGIILIAGVLPYLSIEIDIIKMFIFFLVIPFSSLIYTGIKIITASISFWIKQSGNITYSIYMVNDFARYPVKIYNNMLRTIITYIIPFAFTAYYPVEFILTGEKLLFNIGFTIVISIILMLMGIFLWNKGIKKYESAGS